MRQGRSRLVAVLAVLAACAAGCMSAEEYADDADAEVGPLLDKVQAEVLAGRQDSVLQPAPAAEPAPVPGPAPEPAPPGAGDGVGQEGKSAGRATEEDLTGPLDSQSPDAIRLDLRSSLDRSLDSGRDFQNRRESLYLAGLGLTLTRYNFGPLLNSTISYVWNIAEGDEGSNVVAADFGVSQILDTGGVVTAEAQGSTSDQDLFVDTDDTLFNEGIAFGLNQPLLRGAGYLVSHEALTQAERNIVYEVRDFELFREDFVIDVARDFYDLVSRRKRIANLEQSWRDAVFDRNKTEALRQVDRTQDEDVFNARRREIDAENTLIEARTDYKSALDDFKITLGLPTTAEVVVVDEVPPYQPVALDEASSVEVALHNRLDLMTARDRLEDVERSVIIARDSLRPDLACTAGAGVTESAVSAALKDVAPDDWTATFGLALTLPLNRQAERNAWRSALISLDRARRDLQLTLDDTEADVRAQLRSLKQTEQQIELQKEQIAQEQRAVAVTQIRYDSGDADSRDLLDARQSLVDAQNALIDLYAQHVIARLTLMRTLGILFLDDDGMWIE